MPQVSVIIPCLNEESTILLVLEALSTQTFPHQEMEVIIADGLSTDRTREVIANFQGRHPGLNLRVIDNPNRSIPSALNSAIRAASGKFLIRLDAHCIPHSDYIERSVQGLEAGLGENVGGVWEIKPGGEGWQARSIAAAAAHPLGVGDAMYRRTAEARAVDTVPFGAFRREMVDQIGGFDERLLANEDYEFNARIRHRGGRVWLDPTIRSAYFSRPSFASLARQYWRYGYWKARMLLRYPKTIRWRQALPPLFAISLLAWLVLLPWFSYARWLFVIELASYFLILFVAGFCQAIKMRDPVLTFGLPLAIFVMHISWGSAFLWSLITK